MRNMGEIPVEIPDGERGYWHDYSIIIDVRAIRRLLAINGEYVARIPKQQLAFVIETLLERKCNQMYQLTKFQDIGHEERELWKYTVWLHDDVARKAREAYKYLNQFDPYGHILSISKLEAADEMRRMRIDFAHYSEFLNRMEAIA